jgi:hypothetical protein
MFYEKTISDRKDLTTSRMTTHQFHKTAQFRLLEIVEFAIKSITLITASLLLLDTGIFMQCKGVGMQLEAKKKMGV